MKRNGFTLIETLVSIFIVTILFSVGISIGKFRTKLENDMENTEYIYEIQNLFIYGKAVCREKNKAGKISINTSENKIRFVEGWDNIEKVVTLPKGYFITGNHDNLLISSNGKITAGITIQINDNDGKIYKIIIRPGVDKWRVSE